MRISPSEQNECTYFVPNDKKRNKLLIQLKLLTQVLDMFPVVHGHLCRCRDLSRSYIHVVTQLQSHRHGHIIAGQ